MLPHTPVPVYDQLHGEDIEIAAGCLLAWIKLQEESNGPSLKDPSFRPISSEFNWKLWALGEDWALNAPVGSFRPRLSCRLSPLSSRALLSSLPSWLNGSRGI